MTDDDSDLLDGCDLDFTIDPTSDEDLPWVVLFATAEVEPDEEQGPLRDLLSEHRSVHALKTAWHTLFGGDDGS